MTAFCGFYFFASKTYQWGTILLSRRDSEKQFVIHEISGTGEVRETSLRQYAHNQEVRMEELDYVYNSTAYLSRALSGKVYAEAYQVGDIFLCYKIQSGFVINSGRQLSCYLFPTRISEVVLAIRAL